MPALELVIQEGNMLHVVGCVVRGAWVVEHHEGAHGQLQILGPDWATGVQNTSA